MRLVQRLSLTWLCLLLLAVPAARAQQNASVSGTITDATTGESLAGASVLLSQPGSTDMLGGSASGADGRYRIGSVAPGSYVLTVRFVGFQEAQVPVVLAAGQNAAVDVGLQPGGFDLNAVVVTASRQREKVLDAPASISVIAAEEVVGTATPSTVDVLRNTTGVDMARTGVDRSEIVLRGFNNAFSGAAYVMTDYRLAAVPSLGVNLFSIMPTQAIDVESIEVVRGPASALYGAGVDAGAIHFISKDPFTHPGTTISVTGGERALASGQLRHAGVVGTRLGYKLTGAYTRADDWELDIENDEHDRAQAANDVIPRNYDYESFNVNGLLQYRLADDVTLSLNGGHSGFTGTVLSGIGTLLGDGFGYSYGQLRLQAGHLFAQAYVNRNDAGSSTVYGTGQSVVDKGMLYNAQAQYDFGLSEGRHTFIVGADAKLIRPETEGTILGRNEEDDDISEVGAYAQATTRLSPMLDLTLALRGDYNNIVEDFQLSPRAAVVFKPTGAQSVRATYNRAFSSPGTNSLFLDIGARVQPLASIGGTDYRLVFQGRGAAQGFTFNNYRSSGAAAFSLPVPGVFGRPIPVNTVPLAPIYGVAIARFGATLRGTDPLPAPLTGLNAQQRGALAALLESLTPLIPQTAVTAGTLGIPDGSAQGYRTVAGPVDIEPLKQTTTQSFELGYKGLFANRFLVEVDAYYTTKENFIGPLLVESPLVYLPQLTGSMAQALGPIIQAVAANNPQAAGFLQSLGLTPQAAAGLVAQLLGAGFASTPVAVVQPDQAILATSNPGDVGAFLTYRNYGNIAFWGTDVSLQYMATGALTLFGNVSFVSDDLFDDDELDEPGTGLELALNAPTVKVKAGFDYRMANGFSFNASGRYTEGFPVRSGPYVGDVKSYTLLDLGAGYDFGRTVPGLQLNVLIQNVLDNDHREFIGAPQIGRMALARVTYTL